MSNVLTSDTANINNFTTMSIIIQNMIMFNNFSCCIISTSLNKNYKRCTNKIYVYFWKKLYKGS